MQALSSKSLERAFGSDDDLSVVVSDTDRSLSPDRVTEILNPAAAVPTVARFTSKSEYSWLATLQPGAPVILGVNNPVNYKSNVTDLYTLSLVVVKNRDLLYLPAGMTARAANSPPDKQQAPQGERVVLVEPQSGNFLGGNGGRVRLIGNDAVDAGVHVGDWIMLSRYYDLEQVAGTPNLMPVSLFRWYRIVAVDSSEQYENIANYNSTLTGTEMQVWTQDVVLDGPDWVFTNQIVKNLNGGGTVTWDTPTCGTLVKGAVSVFERVVTVAD